MNDSSHSFTSTQLSLFPPTPSGEPPRALSLAEPVDTRWLKYFNRDAAIQSVAAHIAALGSSRNPEQHTRKSYQSGLMHLLQFMGDQLPTIDLLQTYVAGLVRRGLASSTINTKYLAVARHYLRALSRQRIRGLHGEVRDYVSDCRDELILASTIKSLPREITTHESALNRDGFVRLTAEQVITVLDAIDRTGRAGLRDYAMLLTGFTTGLRLAELRRITPESIRREGDVYLITVRRKRNNFDPVVLDPSVFKAITQWVESFNGKLEDEDPRRIESNKPVWQPLSRVGAYLTIGANGYTPATGLSGQGWRDVVERRTGILGPEFTCGVHDLRRTVAFNLDLNGVKLTTISAVLGHANVATTDRYIGRQRNYAAQNVLKYVDFIGMGREAADAA